MENYLELIRHMPPNQGDGDRGIEAMNSCPCPRRNAWLSPKTAETLKSSSCVFGKNDTRTQSRPPTISQLISSDANDDDIHGQDLAFAGHAEERGAMQRAPKSDL